MEAVSQFLRDWVDRGLALIGINGATGALNRWVILLFIVLFALLIDAIIRIGVARVLKQIVSRTKAAWDDHLFDSSVIKRLCNFITPTIIYILLPIAFADGAEDGIHQILERGVEIYMVIACIRFVNTLLKVCFDIAEQHPAWQGKPIKGLMQTGQVIVICIGTILIISCC